MGRLTGREQGVQGGEGDRQRAVGLTPEEAAEALSEAGGARRDGRRAAVVGITQAPLVIWGVVWCADYAAFQFLSETVAALLSAGLAVVAFALSRRVGEEGGARSGWEREVVGAWWVLAVGSVGLAVVVGPAPKEVVWLLLGAFWGIALALYAVVSGDRALGVLGVSIVVVAAVLRVIWPPLPLLLFGLVCGGGMAILGLVRWLASPERASERRSARDRRARPRTGRWAR